MMLAELCLVCVSGSCDSVRVCVASACCVLCIVWCCMCCCGCVCCVCGCVVVCLCVCAFNGLL